MARTVKQIENQILEEVQSRSELTGLTSASSTAIYTLWIYVTATVIYYFERILDLFKMDIQQIVDHKQYGTEEWWYQVVLAYQHGDLLSFLDNVYQYAAIHPEKQIVRFCSITTQGGKVQIKAAGANNGQPAVLSNDEINGLISYFERRRPAGVRFVVQSLQADLLKITGNIYYDASGDINIIRPAVKAAIQDYLANLNTTNFNGTLFVNRLIDAVQAVPGIVQNQFDLVEIAAKNGSEAYQSFTSRYQPKSGYFMVDPEFNLDKTLTFLT